MIGWLSAKCPLGTYEKTWTETRMQWLTEKLGRDRMLRARVILPTEEFFPEPFDGTVEHAQRLMRRLCGYLSIPPDKLSLEVCEDEQLPGATGHYDRGQRTVIRIAESQLDIPQNLVATLSHELSHELLLGGGLLTEETEDHEWITDLLMVYLGIGIFAANASMNERYISTGNWSSWSIGRQGYLPARMFGYAFALFARARGEERPAWAQHLRLDAASALRGGLRYLRRTDDTLFRPETAGGIPRRSVHDCIDRLRTGTPSVRLAAIWETRDQRITHPDVVRELIARLEDRDRDIIADAAQTLTCLGPEAAAEAMPKLLWLLSSPDPLVQSYGARALGRLGLQPDEVIPELTVLLESESGVVLAVAADGLRRFGQLAESAERPLLVALERALVDCHADLIAEISAALAAVSIDPIRAVRKHFPYGSELRPLALSAIGEQQALAEGARETHDPTADPSR